MNFLKSLKIILLISLILIPLNSCRLNPFSWGGGGIDQSRTDRAADKKSKEIEEAVRPPAKPFSIAQGESDILKMAEEDIDKANNAITRKDFDQHLSSAKEKVRVVLSSIGLSPKDTADMSDSKKDKIISDFRKDMLKYKQELYQYQQEMESYRVEVSELKDIIKEKDSMISSLKKILIVLVVVSVLVAAFVPGGMIFVKRFWTGGFKVAHMFGKKAYEALTSTVKGINEAMDRNKAFDQRPEGSDRTFREMINDSIRMNNSDPDFIKEISQDRNHFAEVSSKTSKYIRKVFKDV